MPIQTLIIPPATVIAQDDHVTAGAWAAYGEPSRIPLHLSRCSNFLLEKPLRLRLKNY